MSVLQVLGLFAGSLFAYAAVPAAIRTIRAGKHLGTPTDIMVAIFFGTIAMYAYLRATRGFDWVLAVNYSVEALSWGILLFYKVREVARPQSAGQRWVIVRERTAPGTGAVVREVLVHTTQGAWGWSECLPLANTWTSNVEAFDVRDRWNTGRVMGLDALYER